MATFNFHRVGLLFIYLFGGVGCHQINVSDTPPDDGSQRIPVETPVAIQLFPEVDTVAKKTEIVIVPGKTKDTIKNTITVRVNPINYRDAVRSVYLSQVGIKELTGNNDGVRVEQYLAATGLKKGNPWCSAFVRWCFDRAGVKTNISAYSPTAFNRKNVVMADRKFTRPVQHGDVFVLYYSNLGRIGHTGFVDRDINGSIYETVEGNTNSQDSREGNGVYKRRRSYNATHGISDWTR